MKENSAEWILCESHETKIEGPLWWCSYLYYLSKYYDLLDTILQLLAGKTPRNYILHVYHHSVVLFMSWGWMESGIKMMLKLVIII